ncbi:MAG: lycopene cyclase domain-containing protein [Halobacteriaceae archaeon]
MSGLTYPQFHAAFTLPALLLLAAVTTVARRRSTRRTVWVRGAALAYWADVALLVGLAVAYTAPWDNYLIAQGVWEYGPGRTLARLNYAPVSEYVFFGGQTVLTALWLSALPAGRNPPTVRSRSGQHRHTERIAGVVGATVLFAVGWWLLGTDATFYLGAILAWAAPVLALQWGVGAPALRDRYRTVALGAAVPTLYLSGVDRIAIHQGVWELSARYTTGVTVAGLPVEEALFFLTTNLFVVQGLILARWVRDGWS